MNRFVFGNSTLFCSLFVLTYGVRSRSLVHFTFGGVRRFSPQRRRS